MSRTVENKVVEMQFKNQQFETAVAKSINSINELNKSINLLEGTKALKSLDRSVNSLDFSGVNAGMQSLTDRFSTLGVIGASVINTITSGITSNLMSALSAVGSKVAGLFNEVKQRGIDRAMALQQARFSFQGLISTSSEGKNFTEEQTAQRIDDIMAAVNRSVADTPYSLASAARAASVLAASYGTSNEAIGKMETTLKTISGLAAQTGASYESVSDVMQNAAASGVLMGEELRRMSQWGLGARTYLKDYINANSDLRRQMNDILSTKKDKRNSTQLITEADVTKLASNGAITMDIVNDVFGVFFDNAQKANDTLSGVRENIGAALGRLGALFAEPLLENKGPIVLFLQTVKSKISDIANAIKAFEIDKNFVSTVTTLIDKANELLQGINVSDFSIFERVGNSFKTISRALNTDFIGSQGTNFSTVYSEALERWRDANPVKTYNEILEDVLRMDNVSMEMLRDAEDGIYARGMTAEEILNEVYRRARQQSQETEEAQTAIFENSKTVYDNIRKTEEVWEYDYFGNLIEAINNFKDAFSEIGNIIFETIGEGIPELREFFDIITGNDANEQFSLRKVINGIVESIRSASENFKNFVNENEPFRSFLSGIGSAFVLIWRSLKMLKEIATNAFNSFKPLFERFASLGGIFGDFLGDMVAMDDETDVFGATVTIVSRIIDKFAQILITAYDEIGNFILEVSGKESVGEFFSGLVEKIRPIPGKISYVFDKIKSAISTFFGYLSGEIKDFKMPDIGGFFRTLFGGKTQDARDTGGTIDDIGNVAETVSTAIEENSEPIQELTENSNKLGGIFDLLGAAMNFVSEHIDADSVFGKAFNTLVDVLINNFIKGLDIDVILVRLNLFGDFILKIAGAIALISGGSSIKSIANGDMFKTILSLSDKSSPLVKGFSSLTGFLNMFQNMTNLVGNQIQRNIDVQQKARRMEALGTIIKNIALVIAAIAAAVFILVISIKILAGIKTEYLVKGAVTIGIIMILLAAIVAGIVLLAWKLSKDTNSRTGIQIGKIHGSKTDTPMTKLIFSIAVLIGAIAVSIMVLAGSMIALSIVPDEALTRGRDAMLVIGGILLGLLIVLTYIIYIFINKFQDSIPEQARGSRGKSKLNGIINSMSALIGVITVAIKKMADAIEKLSAIPEDAMNRGLKAFTRISIVFGVLMVVIMGFIYLVLKTQVKTKEIIKMGATISAIMIVLAFAFKIMAEAFSVIASAPSENMDKAMSVFTEIAIILGVMTVVIAVLTGLFEYDVKNLILSAVSVAILAGSLALVCVGIGEMVKALGESGFKVDEVKAIINTIAIFLGGIVVIAAIIGGIAGSTGIILAGIAVVAVLVAAIGAAALGIGAGVALVGAGVLLFAKAVDILITTFKQLDKGQVKKILKNLKYFVEELPEIIFAGFRSFFRQIDRHGDFIVNGLINLLSLVFRAIFSWIPAAFKTWLGTLGSLIDILLEWLGENATKITTLITTIWDLLMELLGGPDGRSGILADLLGLLFGTLEALFMGNGEYEGLINYTIRMMLYWCGVVEENAKPLANAFFEAVIAVINAMADAVDNHHEELSTAIDNLIDAVIGALEAEFGTDSEGQNKTSTDIISKFVKSMFLPSLWIVTPTGKAVLTGFREAVADTLSDLFRRAFYYGSNPIVHWLIKGVLKKLRVLRNNGNLVAGTIYEAITAGLEVESPSKKMVYVGEMVDMGLVVGMENNKKKVEDAAGKAGKSILTPFDKIKQKLHFFMSDMMSELNIDSFTITPTMDLTQIQEGFSSIQGMMDGTSELDISALSGNMTDSLNVSETAEGFDDVNMPDLIDTENMTPETVVNFTQNNYSPESLSRIDIYRDTKNALNNPTVASIFNR